MLGIISPMLARHFWVCEILCHFQPQYVALLMALTAAFAVGRRWWLASATAAILLLAVAIWILPLYRNPRGNPTGPPNLRILSANLDCHNPSPEKFLALVKRERPQIVLLYELTRVWAPLLEEKLSDYPYSRLSPSPGHSGFGIFSTIPLDEESIIEVGPYPNFVVTAKLTVGDQQLRIFGTHPLAPYKPAEMRARNQQLAGLATLVGNKSERTIVAGDFNTSSWSPCFRDFVRDTGLRDSRNGFGILPTFPSYFWPVRTTIDHCLVSDDIEVIDRRVGPDITSDHLPILIDVQVPTSAR